MNSSLVKDCLKLILITVVAGICLGAIYGITKEPIAMQQEKAKQEAYKAVFPDAEILRMLKDSVKKQHLQY